MARKLNIGSKFKLTEDAISNYGENYRGKVFTVRQWYDHYVKPSEMSGDPHGHPGYDESGGVLYGSKELNFDVYDWEMVAE